MKRLTCEMCGSTDLIKQDGVFVCQSCGCKYSVEEAKKMMIEGVVEVTGTIKVDNTEKIEKMLINARRAFSDGKYSEAQSLFGQVLNEETENAEAILYQGLALGWQGNTVRYTIDKAGDAAERAIKVFHAQKGDGKEFEHFFMKALNEITELGFALSNLCEKKRDETIKKGEQRMEDLKRLLSSGGDPAYIIREVDRLKPMITEEYNKYRKINDTSLLNALSVYATVIGMIGNTEIYDKQTYLSLNKSVTLFANKATLQETVDTVKSLLVAINVYIKRVTDKEEEEKKKAIEAYWENHKEEKQKLEEEKVQLTEERSNLDKKEKDYRSQINSLNTKMINRVPAEEERDGIRKRISELRTERSNLGFFKGKEKKEIDAQIEELEKASSQLDDVISDQRTRQREACKEEIKRVEILVKPIPERIKEIDDRIVAIEEELTKSR